MHNIESRVYVDECCNRLVFKLAACKAPDDNNNGDDDDDPEFRSCVFVGVIAHPCTYVGSMATRFLAFQP